MSAPKQRGGEPDEDYAVRLSAYREREREQQRERRQDPAVRERERERKQDPAYREQHRERNRERRQDPAVREREREQQRERRQDPAVREREREQQRERRRVEIESCGNPAACQCCGESFRNSSNGSDGRNVDHDHESLAVRGILCSRCNTERSRVEDALRSGRLALHLAAIHEHSATVRLPRKSAKRVVKVHPSLFDPVPGESK